VATTEKVAVEPWSTVWLAGWVVMVGGRFTVKETVELVTFPLWIGHFHGEGGSLSVATVAGVSV